MTTITKLFALALLGGIAWGSAAWHDQKAVDAWNCGFIETPVAGMSLGHPEERCAWARTTNAYECGAFDQRNFGAALHIIIVEPTNSSIPKQRIEKRPERCERLYWLEQFNIGWRTIL